MTPTAQMLILAVVAYLVGAIPFGYVVGRLKGVDIRKEGSGNIGATNVGRVLGKRYFWLVFALDAGKGLGPMLAGRVIAHGMPDAPAKYLLWLLVGVAAMVGHVFPIYLGFKGGKGVATALGIMLGVYPYYVWTAVPAVGAFVLVFAVSRFISLASITGAVCFPAGLLVLGWIFGWDLLGGRWPLLLVAVLLGGLVVVRHRANIARLRAGTEPKFTGKKKA
jgi:glycerol-3-phosphate acyltransferase PlsY